MSDITAAWLWLRVTHNPPGKAGVTWRVEAFGGNVALTSADEGGVS